MNKIELYRNKETKEIFMLDRTQISLNYPFQLSLKSLFDNRMILGDLKDYEEINVAPQIDAKSCTKYFIQKEEIDFDNLGNESWNLGDTISVPLKDGTKVSFRVEHINHENGKVYFVSTKSIGTSSMEDNNMNDFLAEFESKLPNKLLKKMKSIVHINKLGIYIKRLSLLSLANVKADAGNLTGADDILFDGLKTDVSRIRENEDDDAIWYWLDTPYASNSTSFMRVGNSGYAGYYDYASNAGGVVVCFAI